MKCWQKRGSFGEKLSKIGCELLKRGFNGWEAESELKKGVDGWERVEKGGQYIYLRTPVTVF